MSEPRKITITKEIEEKMRQHIEDSAYPSDCFCQRVEPARLIEVSELLKALGIEPSQDFAEDVEAFEALHPLRREE